jgi:hypothetical protein
MSEDAGGLTLMDGGFWNLGSNVGHLGAVIYGTN